MVVCLERGADLHMAQPVPLPLTVSCFSKIQIGFTFLVPAHLGSPVERAVKWVCVCVCVCSLPNKCQLKLGLRVFVFRDSKGQEFKSRPFHLLVTTLGKLFTDVPLFPSSTIWYRTGQGAVMPCGWEGNLRSGIALVMHQRLQWLIHL